MIDSLVEFIDGLNIGILIGLFAIYLLILWLLVPIWVYLDSKSKFNNPRLSVVLFLLVLPLNVPGLIFYIIIRPDEHSDDHHHDNTVVNIPVANFTNSKKDFVMGLELKINGDIIKNSAKHDLDLDITLDSADHIKIERNVEVSDANENNDINGPKEPSESFLTKLRTFARDLIVNPQEQEDTNSKKGKEKKTLNKKNKRSKSKSKNKKTKS